MIKTIAYLGTILFFGLWAWPAQAGCSCNTQYQQTYYSAPQSQVRYYPPTYQMNPAMNYNQNGNSVFGDWYGVNNSQQVNNPFGDWYGVNNMASANPNNPFADWYGVNSTSATPNPFADWYGVNNSGVNSQPTVYQAPPVAYAPAPVQYAAVSPYQNSNSNVPTSTYFVAPKTGVNKYAPFGFAGLITAGFFVIKKRKWIFT